jgi:hypothetical protein
MKEGTIDTRMDGHGGSSIMASTGLCDFYGVAVKGGRLRTFRLPAAGEKEREGELERERDKDKRRQTKPTGHRLRTKAAAGCMGV